MSFLVGNDFIPHLPNLHIHSDALPFLWRTYIKVMPTLDGRWNQGVIYEGLVMGRTEFKLHLNKANPVLVYKIVITLFFILFLGYLNESGKLNLRRFEKFMETLAQVYLF